MKVRRANSLILTLERDAVIVHNFITKTQVQCDFEWLEFISQLDGFISLDALTKSTASYFGKDVTDDIKLLIRQHVLLIEGTHEEYYDRKYGEDWRWGHAAGFYHFSIKNTQFLPGFESKEWIRNKKRMTPSPPLLTTNGDDKRTTSLRKFKLNNLLFKTIAQRRSKRNFLEKPIPLDHIGDCLFAGNGIIAFSHDDDFGTLPLTTTPSGGARNPYELYLLANNIDTLDPGIYHYSALEHSLRLTSKIPGTIQGFFGEQTWPLKSSAVILLIANFHRTNWKYPQATAYRVVLMEAGFISQNILLCATKHGLAGAPTAALSEKALESLIGIEQEINQAVVLAIPLGYPKS